MDDRPADHELEGEIALVTGASSGIGRASALLLARAGARVAALARNADALNELAREAPGSIFPIPADLEREASIASAFEAVVARIGNVSILVNNAGHIAPEPLDSMDSASWDRHFAINVKAAYLAIRCVLPAMREAGRGAIVNVASISGVPGPQKFPGFTAYCASKAALIALTESLAAELRGSGVSVNCVSPGSVNTPMLRRVAPSLQPDMSPEDVAQTILFLASPRSAAINGQNIHVYGS
ncbi:MAG: SDR family oxidoreductase [Acidobacteria bacterium]|nr:SDR family oxidoreductase [Acidobacteriota bacterium]